MNAQALPNHSLRTGKSRGHSIEDQKRGWVMTILRMSSEVIENDVSDLVWLNLRRKADENRNVFEAVECIECTCNVALAVEFGQIVGPFANRQNVVTGHKVVGTAGVGIEQRQEKHEQHHSFDTDSSFQRSSSKISDLSLTSTLSCHSSAVNLQNEGRGR